MAQNHTQLLQFEEYFTGTTMESFMQFSHIAAHNDNVQRALMVRAYQYHQEHAADEAIAAPTATYLLH